MQYIITDGKSYVMKNPMNNSKYIATTSTAMAELFTFKQARSLINSKQKSIAWIKSYHMLEIDSGTTIDPAQAKAQAEELCVDGDFIFDENILDDICSEVESVLGLAAYEINELTLKSAILVRSLSYCDEALSDIYHSYIDEELKIPAPEKSIIQKMEIEYVLRRKRVKQTMSYVDVMIMALENNWTLPKLKCEIAKAKYVPYKGRTKVYSQIRQLLKKK